MWAIFFQILYAQSCVFKLPQRLVFFILRDEAFRNQQTDNGYLYGEGDINERDYVKFQHFYPFTIGKIEFRDDNGKLTTRQQNNLSSPYVLSAIYSTLRFVFKDDLAAEEDGGDANSFIGIIPEIDLNEPNLIVPNIVNPDVPFLLVIRFKKMVGEYKVIENNRERNYTVKEEDFMILKIKMHWKRQDIPLNNLNTSAYHAPLTIHHYVVGDGQNDPKTNLKKLILDAMSWMYQKNAQRYHDTVFCFQALAVNDLRIFYKSNVNKNTPQIQWNNYVAFCRNKLDGLKKYVQFASYSEGICLYECYLQIENYEEWKSFKGAQLKMENMRKLIYKKFAEETDSDIREAVILG